MKSIFKKLGCFLTSLVLGASALVGCSDGGGTGKNSDNSFSMVATWTASGLVNHYDSNTSCNAFDFGGMFVPRTKFSANLRRSFPLIPKRLSRTIKT